MSLETRVLPILEDATPLPRDVLRIIVGMSWCPGWLEIGDECDCKDYQNKVYAGFVRNKGMYQVDQCRYLMLLIHFYGFSHAFDEWHVIYQKDQNEHLWPIHTKTIRRPVVDVYGFYGRPRIVMSEDKTWRYEPDAIRPSAGWQCSAYHALQDECFSIPNPDRLTYYPDNLPSSLIVRT